MAPRGGLKRPAGNPARKGRRVLVIDDNVDAAESQRTVLELAGHETLVAHDGPSGIALATQRRPDVILLDIGLPGMDGYQVARALRGSSRTRRAYIVALTGFSTAADVARARHEGCDTHLTKPVDPEFLLELIDTHAAAD